jgi:hypothetical protein
VRTREALGLLRAGILLRHFWKHKEVALHASLIAYMPEAVIRG